MDEHVARRLAEHVGMTVGPVYGRRGKDYLRQRIGGFNNAAHYAPWLVLTDLDNEVCPPRLVQIWLPQPAAPMCLRVAVRAVEAWLLADRESIAAYLGVSAASVPADPDALPNPKEALINLARRSRRRGIRLDMVPRTGSGRSVGPAYDDRMQEFVLRHWRPSVAAEASDSLRRCISALERLKSAAARA